MVIGIRDLFPSELWSKTASVAVMVVLFFAFPTGVWSDQTTGEKSDRDHAVAIAKRRVEALIKREESRAEKEWRDARMALDREESAPSPFRGNYEKLDEPHKKLIQETLHDNLKQVSLVLEDEAKGVGAEGSQAIRADLQDKVVAGATELILARYKRRELDANRDFVGQLASIFNVDNWWLWLWGVVGVAALVGLIAYRGRHMLRRYVFVRKSRFWWAVAVLAFLIAIPAVPTILGWVLGNRTYEEIVKRVVENHSGEGFKYDDSLVDQFVNKADEDLAKLSNAGSGSPANPVSTQGVIPFTAEWRKVQDTSRQIAVNDLVSQKLIAELKEDRKELEEVHAQLQQRSSEVVWAQRVKNLSGGVIGIVLVTTTLGGGWLMDRRRHRQKIADEKTCPRCLSQGSMAVIRETPDGQPITDPNLFEIRCENVISNNPFTECGFVFPKRFLDKRRLSFPTLGVAAAGKTHWLAMTYSRLNAGEGPENVHFDRIATTGSRGMDRVIDELLNERMNPEASLVEMPAPVVFDVRDNDRPFPESLLINVFDFAGSVTVNLGLDHPIRRRQLLSEGYFYFLDPTYSADRQMQALLSFRDQVKLAKGLKPGEKLYTPVAICITKIDLLVDLPFARGTDVVDQFYNDLKRIDPDGKTNSMQALVEKSALVAELRDSIWPNWDIEKQIRSVFGDRFLFFPMTPVGLNEPGEKDLSKRTISPYGITQPLLWLLHMNGHPVLDP